jgi:hypothetical protein
VNPEFARNVWLEMTPQRLLLMVVVLGLIFFAVSLSKSADALSFVAISLYYIIVVLWGSRRAALGVVDEIRDRTWDGQRLSALGAGEMAWGKLFGATIYNWFGGAICLALLLASQTKLGVVNLFDETLYYVGIGVIAQSTALLASLVAIGRRQRHSLFEVFVYQSCGVAAAVVLGVLWKQVDPFASELTRQPAVETFPWWGTAMNAQLFLAASIVLFAAWTLVGCYREMRLELKMRNGPLVWLGFLLFVVVYVAGFDKLITSDVGPLDLVSRRLFLAGLAGVGLTYVMVLLEPKDPVHYRWMFGQLRQGHPLRALSGLQAWMMSYVAAFGFAAALSLWLLHAPRGASTQQLVLAAMGFVTRDTALFVLMQTLPGKRRGDYAALAVLLVLYVLAPVILGGLHAEKLLLLCFPVPGAVDWAGVAIAWAEGLVVASLATTRLVLLKKA